jgi:hypothetical protein
MDVTSEGTVDRDVLAAVAETVAGHTSLAAVVAWTAAPRVPRKIEHILGQDEFTNDVVVAWGGGVYLVYDTT